MQNRRMEFLPHGGSYALFGCFSYVKKTPQKRRAELRALPDHDFHADLRYSVVHQQDMRVGCIVCGKKAKAPPFGGRKSSCGTTTALNIVGLSAFSPTDSFAERLEWLSHLFAQVHYITPFGACQGNLAVWRKKFSPQIFRCCHSMTRERLNSHTHSPYHTVHPNPFSLLLRLVLQLQEQFQIHLIQCFVLILHFRLGSHP